MSLAHVHQIYSYEYIVIDAAVTPASYKVQNYNRLKFLITLTTEYIHNQADNDEEIILET